MRKQELKLKLKQTLRKFPQAEIFRFPLKMSFLRKQESRTNRNLWTPLPAFAGTSFAGVTNEEPEGPFGLNNRGVSLLELMITVAILVFVIAAILYCFTFQNQAAIVQAQVVESQQNARIAVDSLAKDIRMAGFGMPIVSLFNINGFEHAITAVNNDTNAGNTILDGTDQITVITGYRQVSTLSSAAPQGASQITLVSGGDKFNDTTKKYVCIDGITSGDTYEIASRSGDTLTLTYSLTRGYKAGALVFLVKSITYSVNTDFELTRNEGWGAQPLAFNIEDLQLAYQLSDGAWTATIGGAGTVAPPTIDQLDNIRAVRINVLSRTPREDLEYRKTDPFVRPAIEDHAAAGAGDGFRRRLLTTVVEVRNLAL